MRKPLSRRSRDLFRGNPKHLCGVTGLTLPFISYGGSSLLVNMITVGLLNNIGRCRPFTVAPKR